MAAAGTCRRIHPRRPAPWFRPSRLAAPHQTAAAWRRRPASFGHAGC